MPFNGWVRFPPDDHSLCFSIEVIANFGIGNPHAGFEIFPGKSGSGP